MLSKKKPNLKKEKEFDQRIVDLARVTRVMAGGKRLKFRATVVIGNRKDKVGFGIGKGNDVTIAISKAVKAAEKEMVASPIFNETIPCEIVEKFGAAKVFLKPAQKGTGVIAGGAVRTVLELSGIQNVVGKIYGSKNKINNVKATINALKKLQRMVDKKEKLVKEKEKEQKKNNVKENKAKAKKTEAPKIASKTKKEARPSAKKQSKKKKEDNNK